MLPITMASLQQLPSMTLDTRTIARNKPPASKTPLTEQSDSRDRSSLVADEYVRQLT